MIKISNIQKLILNYTISNCNQNYFSIYKIVNLLYKTLSSLTLPKFKLVFLAKQKKLRKLKKKCLQIVKNFKKKFINI